MRTLILTLLAWACMVAAASADDKTACQLERGDLAIQACTRAIESKAYSGQELAGLYMNRGVELKQQRRLDAAIADYDRAIAIHPDYPYAFNNRANARRDKGDLDGAIADYSAAIGLDPDYAAAYTNRGRVHEMRKNLDQARADYLAALATSNKHDNSRAAKSFARQRLLAVGQ